MMSNAKKQPGNGWIAVDLDGTLAEYTHWVSETHIGPPIPRMVKRVKRWLKQGYDVRVFTARACRPLSSHEGLKVRFAITNWCGEHIGQRLPVTNEKDYEMIEIWDDRAMAVEGNTGRKLGGRSRV
jgi:hypothetical protein